MIAPTSVPPLSLPMRSPRPTPRVPLRPADARPRFTPDGSRELEDHLERTCAKIAAGVCGLVSRRRVDGILLGGGYGRGEGGVWRTGDGDRPYNDLEFYVFLRGNRHLNERRFGPALHVLGEILTPQAGVEVEFKIASLRELEAGPISMFSYDLVMGNQRFAGRDNLLAGCRHHREAGQIPLPEATRLLMNRCTGLLLAQERLQRATFSAADADFVRRNIAKAELALGDAVLVVFGRYHWSVRERHHQLQRLARIEPTPWIEDVVRHHAAGTEFKLHPERSTASRETLRAQQASLAALARKVWLWVEGGRLRRALASPREYALAPLQKCPELAGLRRALVNLKLLGPRAIAGREMRRHPRERILNAMSLLLWEPAALQDQHLRALVQRELRTAASTFDGVMAAYHQLWSQVN
ncbi:MAG: hypothetical protein Q7S40_05685 [Opitutaceae bacterium]|nr:hypothetical protein [Opitutaceae bacterium]